ncbi:LOW QUALITY PROTEIN: geranylgeranyl transferase type-2 subunit alpha [Pterocles gutturalis]
MPRGPGRTPLSPAPFRSAFAPPLPLPGAGPPLAAAMHGRLKLRPPDAARLRQREEKLRLYRSAMVALLDKWDWGELDVEALALTSSILAANPDVGTCWNLCRCALPPDRADWVEGELSFVGVCLGVNPKSYRAWHHLGWVLRHTPLPCPSPAQERALCNCLLAADPRNSVGGHWGDTDAELAFTGELLSCDFSNFSAWHHRGRLLPTQRGPLPPPQPADGSLELVQNAVFTHPNNQSTWVYLRCILSRATPLHRVITLYVNREDATLAVTFSCPVMVGVGSPAVTVTLDGSALEGAWRSAGGWPHPSHTWLLDLPPALATPPAQPRFQLQVTWEGDSAPREVMLAVDEDEAWWQEPIAARELFWPEVGVAGGVLQAQVETCRELLEMEPRSRGCLLMLVLLLSSLDPMSHAEETRRCLPRLREADPLLKGFVANMESRAEAVLAVLGAELGMGGDLELLLQGKVLPHLVEKEQS